MFTSNVRLAAACFVRGLPAITLVSGLRSIIPLDPGRPSIRLPQGKECTPITA